MAAQPIELDYIRLAHEDKLGVGDPRNIDIVGDVDAAKEKTNLPGIVNSSVPESFVFENVTGIPRSSFSVMSDASDEAYSLRTWVRNDLNSS